MAIAPSEYSLAEIFKTENYSLFASNITGAQKFADDVSLWIRGLSVKADASDIQELKDLKRKQELEDRKKLLLNQQETLQEDIATEQDAQKKEDLEHELMGVTYKIGEVNRLLTRSIGGLDFIRDNAELKANEAIVAQVKQGVLTYLNDYVVTGNLGSGTVTFDGQAFVAP
ncbi:hypothetical protein V6R21_21960 [Limibacter armeniacum]|uniref:hypothetical protein n=1 Tax=Limibacter armeniacum TaxID=466084 RepID=UPI002FE6666D